MNTQVAGELEDRIRQWMSADNRQKLTPEDIYLLMNDTGRQLAELFDLWFCKVWGSVTRDQDNAVWGTRAVPPPLDSNGSPLSSSQIAAGTEPANAPYLRAVPFPDGLRRPTKVYYGSISKSNELAYLYEEEFDNEYDFESSGNTPESYSDSGDSLLLGPTPGFEVTLWVQGYYWPEDIEDAYDENEFTRHAPTLLVYAVQDLLIKRHYEEEERLGLFKEDYSRALRAAMAQSGRVHDVARQSRMVRKG